MSIKLSIAIPMYNCEDSIGKNLSLIKDQLAQRTDVEVIICDNSSTDSSKQIVRELIKNDDRFLLLSNEENLGMDRNVFKVVQFSNGEYVHIMSADDFFTRGGIQRILDIIYKYEKKSDLIILSNNYLNIFNNTIMNNHGISHDVFCETGGELLEFEELKMLCLSNIVIKRCLLDKINDWETGVGILWPHLFIVSKILNSSTHGYVFSYDNPLVTVQYGNQGWVKRDAICTYSRALELYEYMIKMCGGSAKSIRFFLDSVISPRTQKSEQFSVNFKVVRKFFDYYKFYYGKGYFMKWVKFSLLLIFSSKRSFFYELENETIRRKK